MRKCQGVSACLVTLPLSAPEVVSKTCFTVTPENVNEQFYLRYSVPSNCFDYWCCLCASHTPFSCPKASFTVLRKKVHNWLLLQLWILKIRQNLQVFFVSYSHARTYYIINFLQIIRKLWTGPFNTVTVILCVCVHSSVLIHFCITQKIPAQSALAVILNCRVFYSSASWLDK